MKKLGLFDADIFAFQASAATMEKVYLQNGANYVCSMTNLDAAVEYACKHIDETAKQLKLDKVILCFTDKENWRYSVLPSYKSNRKSTERPWALVDVKEALMEKYESYVRPTLEADDTMGILATWDKFYPDHRRIIISEDKDMKTVAPAWIFNPAKDFEPWENSLEEGDRFHLLQTIAGDITDGYTGAVGMGMTTAAEMLDGGLMFEQYEHTFKTGARKGTTETRWRKVESPSPWDTVVSCFEKAGQTEADAIVQAQVARICRSSEYNFKDKEVCPWLPKH